jgi:hypothetical protein
VLVGGKLMSGWIVGAGQSRTGQSKTGQSAVQYKQST